MTRETAYDNDMETQGVLYSQECERHMSCIIMKEAGLGATRRILAVLSQAAPRSSAAVERGEQEERQP